MGDSRAQHSAPTPSVYLGYLAALGWTREQLADLARWAWIVTEFRRRALLIQLDRAEEVARVR